VLGHGPYSKLEETEPCSGVGLKVLKITLGDGGGICRGKSCAMYGASQNRLRHVTMPQPAVGHVTCALDISVWIADVH